jgi:hypothetical protein
MQILAAGLIAGLLVTIFAARMLANRMEGMGSADPAGVAR